MDQERTNPSSFIRCSSRWPCLVLLACSLIAAAALYLVEFAIAGEERGINVTAKTPFLEKHIPIAYLVVPFVGFLLAAILAWYLRRLLLRRLKEATVREQPTEPAAVARDSRGASGESRLEGETVPGGWRRSSGFRPAGTRFHGWGCRFPIGDEWP
jgi:hypothetical protein